MQKQYIGLFLIMFGLVFAGCQSLMRINNEQEDIQSKFRGCVITSDLFTGKWNWLNKSVTSKHSSPIKGNHFLLLEITSVLSGKYENIDHEIQIVNSFREYSIRLDKAFMMTNKADLPEGSDLIYFQPNFLKINNEMEYKCAKEGANNKYSSFLCYVQLFFNYHTSMISISGNVQLNEEQLVDIVNPLLEKISNCINDLEKP